MYCPTFSWFWFKFICSLVLENSLCCLLVGEVTSSGSAPFQYEGLENCSHALWFFRQQKQQWNNLITAIEQTNNKGRAMVAFDKTLPACNNVYIIIFNRPECNLSFLCFINLDMPLKWFVHNLSRQVSNSFLLFCTLICKFVIP